MADIISTLPDVVLTHILSFLPTKNSVATSVLSKRYRYLWRSVLTLDFDAGSDRTAIFNFKEFVYSVLLSRHLDHPIKSFRVRMLYGGTDCDLAIINWLNFVVQREPEYLCLEVVTRMNLVKLPLSVLNCTTLKFLHLSFCQVVGFSSVLLPSLKTLQLFNNRFNEVPDFMMFLAGCPILEELYVTLLSFKSDVNFVAISGYWINNSLNFRDWENFSLSKLIKSRVVHSNFDFPLKMLHNVKSLAIEIQKAYRPNDVIPTFHNLTHLKLMLLNYNWNLLTELLKHCPMLRELDLNQADIDLESWTREEGGYIWVDPETVPECFSLHLTTCYLRNFLSLQGELLLAKYILKNARVLQDMRIWNNQETGIKKLFYSFPRASATCELTVFDRQ